MKPNCPRWPKCYCIARGYTNERELDDCGLRPRKRKVRAPASTTDGLRKPRRCAYCSNVMKRTQKLIVLKPAPMRPLIQVHRVCARREGWVV